MLCQNIFIQWHVLWWQTCVGKYWNITAFDSINLCNCPILFYYTSDLRVKVYATSGSIIPAVASRACNKLAEKYIQRNYTRVTFLVLYINKIRMSFCLFVYLFVCLFVCPQTTPREMGKYRWMIHRWMRAFPGTKVIYFRTGYDYLVRKYTKKTNFGPPKYFDFFRFTKCRNFFL